MIYFQAFCAISVWIVNFYIIYSLIKEKGR